MTKQNEQHHPKIPDIHPTTAVPAAPSPFPGLATKLGVKPPGRRILHLPHQQGRARGSK
ncbi:hypothetical protein [Leeia oryzae]|uniref:hypothetical protein n=1 Tax=Leeia oryzae TaxID=356662 RepID=UPI0003773DE0|nr:hypothetical protein [Leeia oryzae]